MEGGASTTVPATSKVGTGCSLDVGTAEGKFFIQRSSPLHMATVWTRIRCSVESGWILILGTGRRVKVRFLYNGSTCKRALAEAGGGLKDVVMFLEKKLVAGLAGILIPRRSFLVKKRIFGLGPMYWAPR